MTGGVAVEAPALDVRDVTVRFGGHLALDAVGLNARAGHVTGLIGPNGAGKTTLFNAITGLISPQRGSILVGGIDVTRVKPFRRARLGLARTFQRLELFTLLTVRENVAVAAGIHNGRPVSDADVDALIDRVGLAPYADARVDALPTGQARLMELARALASRPSVLLLDEPASGQTESETASFGVLVGELAAEGMAVVLVEHDVSLVMQVCDQISVLDFGRIIATGTPAEIRSDAAVLAAYLGAGSGHHS